MSSAVLEVVFTVPSPLLHGPAGWQAFRWKGRSGRRCRGDRGVLWLEGEGWKHSRGSTAATDHQQHEKHDQHHGTTDEDDGFRKEARLVLGGVFGVGVR